MIPPAPCELKGTFRFERLTMHESLINNIGETLGQHGDAMQAANLQSLVSAMHRSGSDSIPRRPPARFETAFQDVIGFTVFSGDGEPPRAVARLIDPPCTSR
jgi:hypothetical protein